MFNINCIKPDDLISFLKFIDQYPSKILSIDKIENELVIFMNKYKIDSNDYIKNIASRYRLKYLYLYAIQKIILE